MSDVQSIEFSNNRTEGHGRETTTIPVDQLAQDIVEVDVNAAMPTDQAIVTFIGTYETEDGLRRYAPLSDEEMEALIDAVDAHRD